MVYYLIFYWITSCVNPFCKQNDQEKGFITFETFPKEFLVIGHDGMTINSSLTLHYLMFSYVL